MRFKRTAAVAALAAAVLTVALPVAASAQISLIEGPHSQMSFDGVHDQAVLDGVHDQAVLDGVHDSFAPAASAPGRSPLIPALDGLGGFAFVCGAGVLVCRQRQSAV